jgi:ubiquinone/menaquinone biosynthesis C-methylase UbiE
MTGRSHLSRTPGTEHGGERERVQRVHEGYSADPYYRKIWADSRASRFMSERKWALVTKVLRQEAFELSSAWILDLGAGRGSDLARFRELGARPGRIVPLDLLEEFARSARQAYPWMPAIVGDAATLPFRSGRFQVVYQSTMLSSVPEEDRRVRIFGEIDRILAPGGIFLSYDTRYLNPWNAHTRPLRSGEIARALPGWSLRSWSVTAIPQIVRLIAPVSLGACRAVEAIPPLRSHLLVLARKPGQEAGPMSGQAPRRRAGA